jgi:hypothetical protein
MHNSTNSRRLCVLAATLLLSSCATTKAVAEAPVEFWLTLERIAFAMGSDVESLLFVFGL